MPASPAKSPQTKDPYAATGKALASQAQRLRGWLSTDAGRLPELVDALNALVAHRLDGHAYAAAGAEAQEAVKRSADLLLGSGPIGPYSSAVDAGRCGTALVQLATLQAAIGLVDAARASLDSWDGLRAQVAEAGTTVVLSPAVGRRALEVAARVALAAGDAASANSFADAALNVAGPLDAEGFGRVDLDHLVSDTRWAAGRSEQSLGFLHSAKEAYERVAGERLADPGRLAPALAERLAAPMPALYRDLADRLGDVGELDLGLTNRRLLVDRLRALAPRSESLRPALAGALTDLASDLLGAGRAEEAFDAASEAERVAAARDVSPAVRLLCAAVLARASLASGRPAPAAPLRGLLAAEAEAAGSAVRSVVAAALAATLSAEGLEEAAAAAQAQATEATGAVLEDQARGVVRRGDGTVSWTLLDPARAYGAPLAEPAGPVPVTPTWLEQERAQAHRQELVRAEEARREAEERAAEEARTQEAARAAAAARASAEQQERDREEARQVAAQEAEQAERKRRREERLRQHQADVDVREREQRATRLAEIDARLTELDAAEEPERDRLLAERATFDEAATVPEPVQAPEPEPVPEPVDVPEPEPAPEPVEEPEPAPEPVEEPEPEPAPEALEEPEPEPEPAPEPVEAPEPEPGPEPEPEPDELELAEAAWTSARASGGRREARAAAERVVELLRARAAADPGAYDARLRAALEHLAGARLRVGDIFGSRSANREARSLG